MKKIKVSEASGPVLDWLVATAEGHRISLSRNWYSAQDEESFSMKMSWKRDDAPDSVHWWAGQRYSPSTDWSQGGPIIETKIDCLRKRSKAEEASLAYPNPNFKFKAEIFADIDGYFCAFGPTPLIAGLRCFVVSRLGETVEVPGELT